MQVSQVWVQVCVARCASSIPNLNAGKLEIRIGAGVMHLSSYPFGCTGTSARNIFERLMFFMLGCWRGSRPHSCTNTCPDRILCNLLKFFFASVMGLLTAKTCVEWTRVDPRHSTTPPLEPARDPCRTRVDPSDQLAESWKTDCGFSSILTVGTPQSRGSNFYEIQTPYTQMYPYTTATNAPLFRVMIQTLKSALALWPEASICYT